MIISSTLIFLSKCIKISGFFLPKARLFETNRHHCHLDLLFLEQAFAPQVAAAEVTNHHHHEVGARVHVFAVLWVVICLAGSIAMVLQVEAITREAHVVDVAPECWLNFNWPQYLSQLQATWNRSSCCTVNELVNFSS